MRKFLIAALLLAVILVPFGARAQLNTAETQALMQQIQMTITQLLAQIQALLAAQGRIIPTAIPVQSQSNWQTYTNTKYNYSIKYPNNWYINAQYSNLDFTPRGPAPHDYIGGDTSVSNYSEAYINDYQRKNGDLAYPLDYTVISWMFWKTPLTTSSNPLVKDDADSVKKEDIVINGVPGIKTTILGQHGIGGATKPNSVSIGFKLNGEYLNISYGFDSSNSNVSVMVDQIMNSLTLKP